MALVIEVYWLGLVCSLAASVVACLRAHHWKQLANFHEMRVRETAERAEDREREEWQNGFREGWEDHRVSVLKPANDTERS